MNTIPLNTVPPLEKLEFFCVRRTSESDPKRDIVCCRVIHDHVNQDTVISNMFDSEKKAIDELDLTVYHLTNRHGMVGWTKSEDRMVAYHAETKTRLYVDKLVYRLCK